MQFSYYKEVTPENIDLLIIAGDLLSYGDAEETRYASNFLDGLMEDNNIKEIICLLGNHDVEITNETEYYKLEYPNIDFKLKEEFIWNEIKFFVTGYSPFIQSRWTNYFSNLAEKKKL